MKKPAIKKKSAIFLDEKSTENIIILLLPIE